MRDESKPIINAIRGISVALGSHHANRVNASESDRLDQPNDSERAKIQAPFSGSSMPIRR